MKILMIIFVLLAFLLGYSVRGATYKTGFMDGFSACQEQF